MLQSRRLPQRRFSHDALHLASLDVLRSELRPRCEALAHRALRHERDKSCHDAALLGDDVNVGRPSEKADVQPDIHEPEAYRPALPAHAHLRRCLLLPQSQALQLTKTLEPQVNNIFFLLVLFLIIHKPRPLCKQERDGIISQLLQKLFHDAAGFAHLNNHADPSTKKWFGLPVRSEN